VALIAVSATILQIHQDSMGAIVAAGTVGLISDSVLGATIQSQRWCAQCGELTERIVHGCGARTAHRRGAAWLDNDGVNAIATLIGALVGASVVVA
jgi:uncharacterized membrane protein